MFVIYNNGQRVPIKVWLANKSDLDDKTLEQATNLASLPFVYKHVVLAPDCHMGYGMPIGGVIATTGVVIPNAVGVDIGCGMRFVQTNIRAESLTQEQYEYLVEKIMKEIPVGFLHHTKAQKSEVLDKEINRLFSEQEKRELTEVESMIKNEVLRGYQQIGTLGGGNHFIELQKDDEGYLCIMLHSGSRNFGYKIANYFNNISKKLNEKWYTLVDSKVDLAFLPTDTQEGQDYVRYMNLALDFAQENRTKMLEVIKDEITKVVQEVEFSMEIDTHHNYVTQENHFKKNVWVHRKGSIRVRKDELGIVPSAMGGYSYIVRGIGNTESFYSCSHGAGRKMGRMEAERRFSNQDVLEDLKQERVILGNREKSNMSEECKWAYKDIDVVIANELDLIEVVKRVKTIAVIKG